MLRYAVTIFLSAFLLFLVQPLIGRYILPWFGGGSGVWTACMLFYQAALLAGYAYAHVLALRGPQRLQPWIHIAVLALAMLWLPIVPDEAWKPEAGDAPVAGILLLLLATIGLPFVALSATGPLLQYWFSRTHVNRSPYRLYALSNAGSLLALVAYPFVMEPALTRQSQAIAWSIGFGVFAVACGYTAWMLRAVSAEALRENVAPAPVAIPPPRRAERKKSTSKHRSRRQEEATHVEPLASSPSQSGVIEYLLWIGLPACASVMLLASTSQLSEEVAPVPFLWVLTLGVYLLTFIIAFEWPRLYVRSVFIVAMIASPWLLWFMLREEPIGIGGQMAVYIFVLFACGMVCHGEVYRLRPQPQHLTSYYLLLATGGALGGAIVAIVAPAIFNRNLEIYFTPYVVIALMLVCMVRDPHSIFFRGQHRLGWLMLISASLAAGLLIRLRLSEMSAGELERTRSFYGTLAVRRHLSNQLNVEYRALMHGRINHGAQHFTTESEHVRRMPTEYYGANSGVGVLLRQFPKPSPRRIGIVGLGVGTLATYAEAGDVYRFYEINPDVVRLANEYFTFLADARARGVEVDVVLNDARLALEQERPQQFDVLVLDAFSGDAIPTHLLTAQAFEIYQRHLADGGAIIVHVSNRYLDLHPIAHRLGLHIGLDAVFLSTPDDPAQMLSEAHWILLTSNDAIMNLPGIRQIGAWPPGPPKVSLWTDDHFSILEVLR